MARAHGRRYIPKKINTLGRDIGTLVTRDKTRRLYFQKNCQIHYYFEGNSLKRHTYIAKSIKHTYVAPQNPYQHGSDNGDSFNSASGFKNGR